MEKTPLEMISILPDSERAQANVFLEYAEKLGCTSLVRYAPAHKSWKCVFRRKNPSRVLLTIECTETRWHVKANLWNINAYRDFVTDCGGAILKTVTDAYNCVSCSALCKSVSSFTLGGTAYKKCVGNSFYFADLCADEWENLRKILDYEYEASSTKAGEKNDISG